jgi:hypothetical protein
MNNTVTKKNDTDSISPRCGQIYEHKKTKDIYILTKIEGKLILINLKSGTTYSPLDFHECISYFERLSKGQEVIITINY